MVIVVITQQELKAKFSYDENTGQFTRRTTYKQWKSGQRAGSFDGLYRHIHIDHIMYGEHRLAMLYMYNILPDEVDHKDGNRVNNRISNLRVANSSHNKWNTGLRADSISGIKGISWYEPKKRYRARLQKNGKRLTKLFYENVTRTKEETLVEAINWIEAKRLELHGTYANNG